MHGGAENCIIHGLHEIEIAAELHSSVRSRSHLPSDEHDHRHVAGAIIIHDRLLHLATVETGHVDAEKNKIFSG